MRLVVSLLALWLGGERTNSLQATGQGTAQDSGILATALLHVLSGVRRDEGLPAGSIRIDDRKLEAKKVFVPGQHAEVTAYVAGARRDSAFNDALRRAVPGGVRGT